MRRKALLIIAILACTLIVPQWVISQEDKRYGGTFIEALPTDITNFNIATHTATEAYVIAGKIYQPLLKHDPNNFKKLCNFLYSKNICSIVNK